MDTGILVAIISLVALIIANILTHYYTHKRELKQRELEFRMKLYSEFMEAYTLLGGNKSYEAHLSFANAVNTLNIIANYETLENVNELINLISLNELDHSEFIKNQNRITKKIILAFRKDLSQSYKGEIENLNFHVISPNEK